MFIKCMVLVVAATILVSILGIYDAKTKKGKQSMKRLLVASSGILFFLCLLGSYFDVGNPSKFLPGSCEVLSRTVLPGERTRYHLRSLSDDGARFIRDYKKGDFPPSGYRLVSLWGKDVVIKED